MKMKARVKMMFVKERDEAFIDAIENDNWDKVKAYAKKYGIPIPRKDADMKAGIYKGAQYCTSIPESTKMLAFKKCLEMGYNPMIKEFHNVKDGENVAEQQAETDNDSETG